MTPNKPSVEGVRRRPRESTTEHERRALSRDLHDAHLRRSQVRTLEVVRDAGIELCSGGIIGMGEKPRDVVSMAKRDLGVVSIPINFLNAIDGMLLAREVAASLATPPEGAGDDAAREP